MSCIAINDLKPINSEFFIEVFESEVSDIFGGGCRTETTTTTTTSDSGATTTTTTTTICL